MNKKKSFSHSLNILLFLVLSQVGLSLEAQTTNSQPIDVTNSKISWIGEKVIGSSHNGNIAVKNGTIITKGKKLISTSLTIEMNDITCHDIESEEWNMKLIKHLKSDDFFSVSTYPEAKFVSTEIEGEGENIRISGKLIIKNISNPITFPATITYQNDEISHISVKNLKVNRIKYGIKTMSASFFDNLKDRAISDEFKLNVMIKTAN